MSVYYSTHIYQELKSLYLEKHQSMSDVRDKAELQEKFNNVITALREFDNILNS
jgi:hypothetical protein